MNDDKQEQPRPHRPAETAEDIFARIQRRRALAMNDARPQAPRHDLRQSASQHGASPSTSATGESLADILRRAAAAESSAKRAGSSPQDAGTSRKDTETSRNSEYRHANREYPGRPDRPPRDYPLLVDEDGTPIDEDAPDAAGSAETGERFPRSQTMRALLRYPTLTTAVGLAVAVPAATLLLRTPATRQTLLRIGKFAAEQEVWKYVRKLTK